MTDYKELIEALRDDYKAWGDGRPLNFFEVTLRCKQAADAIEQLVNDRNASMDALKALHDNGVVVLPCKVGDTVYDIYEAFHNGEGDVRALKVTDIHIHLDKRNKAWIIIGGYYFALDDFGKTVFLTREEAEKALEKRKGGDE